MKIMTGATILAALWCSFAFSEHSKDASSFSFARQAAYHRAVHRAERQYEHALHDAKEHYLEALETQLAQLPSGSHIARKYRWHIQRLTSDEEQPHAPRSPKIKVLTELYGLPERQQIHVADRIAVQHDQLLVAVTNAHLGKLLKDRWKHLVIELEYADVPMRIVVPQTKSVNKVPFLIKFEHSGGAKIDDAPHTVTVEAAGYGVTGTRRNVKRKIRVGINTVSVRVDNAHLGNPVKGQWKNLLLELTHGNLQLTLIIPQTHDDNRTPFSIAFGQPSPQSVL